MAMNYPLKKKNQGKFVNPPLTRIYYKVVSEG